MHESDTGVHYSGIDWLMAHHQTKATYRRQMVEDLQLQPGDRVLDLASGPGLWTVLFADKVKPNGRAIGLDISTDSIEFAQNNIAQYPDYKDIIEYKQGSLEEIPYDDNSFDVTFCGNSLTYFKNNTQKRILQEQKRVTKPGGRVISKEFDDGTIIYSLISPELLSKVMAATARCVDRQSSENYFDHFVGRRVRQLFFNLAFQSVSTRLYPTPIFAPLSPENKTYLIDMAQSLSRAASPYLSESDLQEWNSYFDSTSAHYILDREDFYYYDISTITIGTV